MSSIYYQPPSPLLTGFLAKASDLNARISAIDAGFAAVQADIQLRLGNSSVSPSLNNVTINNATFTSCPSVPTSLGVNGNDAVNVIYLNNALNIANLSAQTQAQLAFYVAMASLAWLNQ